MSRQEIRVIGIVGAGTMGTGIAQVAASAGHTVYIMDQRSEAVSAALEQIAYFTRRGVEKGKMTPATQAAIMGRILPVSSPGKDLPLWDLAIEAIAEDPEAKRQVFSELATFTRADCLFATNTSSLSVTALAASSQRPDRFLGLHFFNPAPLMRLVELIPGPETAPSKLRACQQLMEQWGKTPVLARDTPGFIVNRVARPFYGEALRILEEGIAPAADIDWAMETLGGFRMGPFKLMDLIGLDVNFAVTQTVFRQMFFDPRYRPSILQQRMVEAGHWGRKTGRGFYDYSGASAPPRPSEDPGLKESVFHRILALLINEAADALRFQVASREDIDTAMTLGVNYPKGLFQWAEELGWTFVQTTMDQLYDLYREDRYRLSPFIRQQAHQITPQ